MHGDGLEPSNALSGQITHNFHTKQKSFSKCFYFLQKCLESGGFDHSPTRANKTIKQSLIANIIK
jgi:hypothetical protein